MTLNRETVKTAFIEFSLVFGMPKHIDSENKMAGVVDIYHRELSKQFTEETFGEGLTIAWNQSRRFPVVADFHRGFDAPDKSNTPTMAQIGLV